MAELEEALIEQESAVDALLKGAGDYLRALKAWKKACQTGHLNNRQKAAALAEKLAPALAEPAREVAAAWQFDARAYFEGEDWKQDILGIAEKQGLRVTVGEGETLVSSPVVVRAQPSRAQLLIGKAGWPMLRSRLVIEELKRLRDKTVNANSQELLESLAGAYDRVRDPGDSVAKFRDVYDLFCVTPGWKKENPPVAFGQAIYALHRADIRTTRAGRLFEIVYPSGNAKERDVFSVIAEDGKPLRYYGIRFR